jgi:hypothetical protein
VPDDFHHVDVVEGDFQVDCGLVEGFGHAVLKLFNGLAMPDSIAIC